MLIIHNAEIEGRRGLDVSCGDGRIIAVGHQLPAGAADQRLDAGGACLLPGLHDHHIHAFALARHLTSVDCGPPLAGIDALARRLRQAPGAGWIRGVGYHESVAGLPDRHLLDRLVPDRPLRIQHRSGRLWLFNSPAIERLGLDREPRPAGAEVDAQGRCTGHGYRLDDWLRERLGPADPPDLARVSQRLAACGVTGVTDATASNSLASVRLWEAALGAGDWTQALTLMGDASLADLPPGPIRSGPLKLVLDEAALPPLPELVQAVAASHARRRPVAVHCVTRIELIFALGALGEAGHLRGDRIEHGSLIRDADLPLLRGAGVTVVTQPNFIAERGDHYAADLPAAQHDDLYRCASLVRAGIGLGLGTDAPYGDPDPWRTLQAAVHRKTPSGRVLGAAEVMTPEAALRCLLAPADDPGGEPRRILPGAPADLCLLDRPWAAAREYLSRECMRATIRAGKVIWHRDESADDCQSTGSESTT